MCQRYLGYPLKVEQVSLDSTSNRERTAPKLFFGTGRHYNSAEQVHLEHAGNLPPLLECQGNAYLSVRTDRFSVADIIGRTVVIHSDPDDFHSQPAGNAGKKIACGVICNV